MAVKAAWLLSLPERSVAKILNAHPAEIFFTSGGTESSNTAITAAVRDLGCKKIITSLLEHHATLHCAEHLAKTKEAEVSYVKVLPDGHIDMDDLENFIKRKQCKMPCYIDCMLTMRSAT